MNQIHIDRARALRLLAQAVKERGEDYRYAPVPGAGCRYYHEEDSAPGCGVGLALSIAGVPVTVLRDLDNLPEETGISAECTVDALAQAGITLDPHAAYVFQAFQGAQDSIHADDPGFTWGDALARAKEA